VATRFRAPAENVQLVHVAADHIAKLVLDLRLHGAAGALFEGVLPGKTMPLWSQ
jgi:hypothetical protein